MRLDDCNIYVRSRAAGQRVMTNVTRFLVRRLKRKVNEAKSAVARPVERKFLGFSFSNNKEPKRRIAPKVLLRCKQKIRELTRRTRGIRLEQMLKELTAYLICDGRRGRIRRMFSKEGPSAVTQIRPRKVT